MNKSHVILRYGIALLFAIVSFLILVTPYSASAQAPDGQPSGADRQLYLPLVTAGAQTGAQTGAALDTAKRHESTPRLKLLVDTDPGVDDAVALAWLARQPQHQLLGVVTVAGNTSLANTTNNALTILEKLGRQDVPVVMGADAPLVQPLSKTAYFIHGPDGLWFLGLQNPHDLSGLNTDAPGFYCREVHANPGLTLLTLGPLTNVARAVQQCPDTMRLVGRLVILGGARFGGNKTPVTEFNFWQDPEAAAIVLDAGLPATVVLLDAFTDPSVSQKELDKLFAKGAPAIQFLAPAIQQYANVQIANGGQASIPDAVAAALAVGAAVGEQRPAFVQIVLAPGLSRGQSVLGLAANDKIAMVASDAELSALAERAFAYPPDPAFDLQLELGAIFMRAADNAQVVISAPEDLLSKVVLPVLMARQP